MFARISGAALRSILMAMLIVTPSLLLPKSTTNSAEIIALLAILASTLTFIEYYAEYPSFVEFRDAPPLNRMRFVALFVMVFSLTIIYKHNIEPTNLTAMFAGFGAIVGNAFDIPYSPVHLVILMLADTTTSTTVEAVRVAAGVSYLVALIVVVMFLFVVRVMGWPVSAGAFNVWINLPLFDPTAGGDVVLRLQRDSRINIILGLLLPFLIPAVIKAASDLVDPISMSDPQTLIWTISAWAFLPASMVMRGIAMMRIAELIEEMRRRTYANAKAMQVA
ncbi:MAG: hypothetical protein JKY94_12910 [Rhodobacteraceae bacterium]|nr:hypothetical protein [Paracoccaceae bacterium]